MLQRHKVFNVILAFWRERNCSSTPRRGELRRQLRTNNIKMSRQTIQDHLLALEKEGAISLDAGVIVLIRKVPYVDPAQVPLPN